MRLFGYSSLDCHTKKLDSTHGFSSLKERGLGSPCQSFLRVQLAINGFDDLPGARGEIAIGF